MLLAASPSGQFTDWLTTLVPNKRVDDADYFLMDRLSGVNLSLFESTRQIDELIRKRKYKQAIRELKSLVDVLPSNAIVYEVRAALRFEVGNYQGSINDINEALQLNPSGEVAYLTRRGAAYSRLKQFDLALNDLDKVLQLNPHYDLAYYNRGVVFALQGNFEAAIKDFTEALAIDPGFARALGNRGGAYCDIGELNLAQKDLDQALQLDPDLANAYNNRGVLRLKKGDIGSAIQDFQITLRLDPRNSFAHSNLAFAHIQINEYGTAISHYTKAIKAEPHNSALYMNRGFCYAMNGDYGKALRDFKTVVKWSPSDPVGYNNIGFVAFQLGDVAQAREAWANAVQMPNAPAYAYAGYAIALWKDHQRAAAIRHYEKAFRLNSGWRDDLYETAKEYQWTLTMIEIAQSILVEIYGRSIQEGEFKRITVDPDRMGGLPTVRGMRIPVVAIARMMSGGASESDLLKAYPDLEKEDIEEAIQYAQKYADLVSIG